MKGTESSELFHRQLRFCGQKPGLYLICGFICKSEDCHLLIIHLFHMVEILHFGYQHCGLAAPHICIYYAGRAFIQNCLFLIGIQSVQLFFIV